jgi:hypothetical protein
MTRSIRAVAFLGMLLCCAERAAADADVIGGLRLSYYTDAAEPAVGGELLFHVAPSTYFNPNLEFVFKDDSYVTFNLDFHYDLLKSRDTYVWAGAGLAILAVNPPGPEGGHTDAGLNLLFGVGLRRRPVIPYFQAKVILKSETELSLGVGLRF